MQIQAISYRYDIIEHGPKHTNISQIYAGYFLANFLLLLFCLACRVWHETKINYVFIFEYDTRHFLDWRQLSEVCTLFLRL
jgi:hypothetical protein